MDKINFVVTQIFRFREDENQSRKTIIQTKMDCYITQQLENEGISDSVDSELGMLS